MQTVSVLHPKQNRLHSSLLEKIGQLVAKEISSNSKTKKERGRNVSARTG